MSKIAKPLGLIGVLTPLTVGALGVGDIELRSALNQNLVAQIPLVTSPSETAADIKVRLASPYAFTRAGIDRHYFLTGLRFATEVKPDGQTVINVTSRDAVREPFLNFLIEVNWPQGQMLREFTLLLDPPATFSEKKQTNPNLATTSRTVSPAEATPARPVSKPQNTYRASARADQYGPTQINDTLWDIADRFNQDARVSHEQMMMALYEANPDAFYKDNVNSLKVGKLLNKPTSEQLSDLTAAQAKQAFYQHYQQWKDLAGTASSSGSNNTSKLDNSSAKTAVKQDKPLTLLTPGATEAESGLKSGSSIKSPELANEVIETLRQENDELKDRLLEMEQQLATTQKLLDLQNQQLAQIQNSQLKSSNLSSDITDQAEPEVADSVETGNQVETVSQTNQEQVQAKDGLEASNGGAATPIGLAKSDVADAKQNSVVNQPEQNTDLKAEKPKPAVVDQGADKSRVVSEAEVGSRSSSGGFWDKLISDPFNMAIAGCAGLLLALIGIWARRRIQVQKDPVDQAAAKGKAEQANQTDQQAASEGDDFLVATPVGNIDDSEFMAESSFLSEFTPVDFDTDDNDSDEIDPVAEADVYLAYGRYQQAEELIRAALDNSPNRQDCQLKLLEIYYAAENATGFGQFAADLHASGAGKDEGFWKKVTEMGLSICPNHELFNGNSTADQTSLETAIGEDEFVSNDSVGQDLAAKLSAIELPESELDAEAEQSTNVDLDFTNDAGEPEEEAPEKLVALDEEDSDNSEDRLMDFDISLELPEEAAENASRDEEKAELAGNELDFNISSLGTEAVSSNLDDDSDDDIEELEYLADKSDDELELTDESGSDPDDLDDFLSQFSSTEESKVPEAEDEFDLTMDLDLADSELVAAEDSSEEYDESESMLTDIDEIETKLDLAKAYVDMQDNSAATDMLEEIRSKGSDEQIKEAEALLQKLGEMRNVG